MEKKRLVADIQNFLISKGLWASRQQISQAFPSHKSGRYNRQLYGVWDGICPSKLNETVRSLESRGVAVISYEQYLQERRQQAIRAAPKKAPAPSRPKQSPQDNVFCRCPPPEDGQMPLICPVCGGVSSKP